jgi:hypothetical protein
MNGATVGFTDADGVPHAMRLSTSGTFIHGNYWGPKSIFGNVNTSHGGKRARHSEPAECTAITFRLMLSSPLTTTSIRRPMPSETGVPLLSAGVRDSAPPDTAGADMRAPIQCSVIDRRGSVWPDLYGPPFAREG